MQDCGSGEEWELDLRTRVMSGNGGRMASDNRRGGHDNAAKKTRAGKLPRAEWYLDGEGDKDPSQDS